MYYAIFRSEPIYTLNDLAQIGSHNKREKKAYNSNPDIKLEKTKDNTELVPLDSKYVKGFYEKTQEYRKEHEERMKTEREDRQKTFRQMLDKSKSVVADEMIFTTTPGFFDDKSKEDINKWADKCLEFVYEDLGYKKDQVLHATLHMDEKTPHIHCVVIPLVKKFDKRTNTERYTISKKQYIHDKLHLSELQDKYCDKLKNAGFDLERGLKGNDTEHLSVKEYKKITSNLEKELTSKETKLAKSLDELEEQLKTNKNLPFSKESVIVKKETLNCMDKVIKNANEVKDMQPKLDKTFSSMKNFSDNLSKTSKENDSLRKEINGLSIRNEKLESQIGGLTETLDYLKAIISAMVEFIYEIFTRFKMIAYEKEFRREFDEHIDYDQKREFNRAINPKEKDKDDDFCL